MTRKPIRVLAAVAAIVVAGFAVAALSRDDQPRAALVDSNHGNVKFAKGEMKRILNAVDATTAGTARDELVAQGRKLFRDRSLFEKGESCQTCHAEGAATAATGTMAHDAKVPELGTKPDPLPPTDFDGPRDPPALWGLDKTSPYFWNGNVRTLEQAVATPVFGHMATFVPGGQPKPASEPLDCQSVGADGKRSPECEKRAADIAAALIAYIKTLDPPTTAFDQGTTADPALRQKQLDGEKLFQGKGGCIECHGGPLFTDNLEHNTGVPQVTFQSPYGTGTRTSDDLGAKPPPTPPECTANPAPAGCEDKPPANTAFINTPQLRDLSNTAPYMHNGVFATLEQVVGFYNGRALPEAPLPTDTVPADAKSTVSPLNMTNDEMRDLVAYLKSL